MINFKTKKPSQNEKAELYFFQIISILFLPKSENDQTDIYTDKSL